MARTAPVPRQKHLLGVAVVNAVYLLVGLLAWHDTESPGLGQVMLASWLVAVVLTLCFVPYRPPLTPKELEKAARHARTYVNSVALRGFVITAAALLVVNFLEAVGKFHPVIPLSLFAAALGRLDAIVGRNEAHRWRDRRRDLAGSVAGPDR